MGPFPVFTAWAADGVCDRMRSCGAHGDLACMSMCCSDVLGPGERIGMLGHSCLGRLFAGRNSSMFASVGLLRQIVAACAGRWVGHRTAGECSAGCGAREKLAHHATGRASLEVK